MSDAVPTAVKTTLAVMAQIAGRTRTPADDILVQLLKSNEAKIVAAVSALVNDSSPLTPERITAALATVGIKA